MYCKLMWLTSNQYNSQYESFIIDIWQDLKCFSEKYQKLSNLILNNKLLFSYNKATEDKNLFRELQPFLPRPGR